MHESASTAKALVASGVTKDFGGLRALDTVNLQVRQGEILGLIGPNGSGKTTFINVVTGQLPITSGEVHANGLRVTGWPPHKIARVGVMRTFQVVRPFKNLTVLENVEAAAVSIGHVSRSVAREQAWTILSEMGLERRATLLAGTLPTGEERYLEIARALVTRPAFLLLDEPGAGLNDAEVETLLDTLRGIPATLGCGLLVVDHDMRLIMRLCERIHVLDHGRTITEGTPGEVQAHPGVIAAYLGSEATEVVHAAT